MGFAGGVYGTWYMARQLYTAAMYGYVMTGVPERRHYRADALALFRNNVIAAIVLLPILAGGAIISAFQLLGL